MCWTETTSAVDGVSLPCGIPRDPGTDVCRPATKRRNRQGRV